MGWPQGRKRPKKVNSDAAVMPTKDEITEEVIESREEYSTPTSEEKYPSDWHKGMLLNVRNYGQFYAVTLHGEEYSDERPERAMKFTNPALLQDFVSAWYATIGYNPLAR